MVVHQGENQRKRDDARPTHGVPAAFHDEIAAENHLFRERRRDEKRQREHEYLYWEFPRGDGWVAVRWGDWKGLLREASKGNTRMELYDVKNDLLEEQDVAADHPDIVARMWEFIRASHTEAGNPLFRTTITIPEKID